LTKFDWELFRRPIEEALYVEPKVPGGRPSYDKLMMFKIIILQKYYNLSDEKIIWLFKEQLKEKQLSKRLFELFTSQLISNGIVAKEGSIVDASFSAYRSAKIEEYLENKECTSHIHEKGYRGKPLDIQQKLTNTMKSKIRARVEHIFGYMTSIGIQRIESNIGFLNLTYNLFRYEQLIRLQKVKMM